MILLAVLTGILTAYTIRHTTNASDLHATVRRIHAHLLEFRLFFDEPRLVWQAQVDLLRDNLRLFKLFLPATLILALPMAWLILQLASFYGLRPLAPGKASVVTAQLTRAPSATDRIVLQGHGGIQVETPPVRAFRDNQVAWRIRPSSNGHRALDLTLNGHIVTKSIVAGSSPGILSPRRSRSLAEFLLHPEEPRLPEGDIVWLEVDYPRSEAAIPWLVWFVVISTAAALLSSKMLH
jgi:hypothetical protein